MSIARGLFKEQEKIILWHCFFSVLLGVWGFFHGHL